METNQKIKCDWCESEKVVKNVCMAWVEYDFYTDKQDWSEKPTLINEPIENKHYCQECYDKWCNGDLF